MASGYRMHNLHGLQSSESSHATVLPGEDHGYICESLESSTLPNGGICEDSGAHIATAYSLRFTFAAPPGEADRFLCSLLP
jgi:hypothetical protein